MLNMGFSLARRDDTAADLLRSLLRARVDVDAAEPDHTRPCVWVFADGRIAPESLVEMLALWGYGSYVLDNQRAVPQ